MAWLPLKEMRSKDVNDRGNHKKKEQRQMEDVPEPEETFVECERRRFLYGRDMQRDEVNEAGKPSASDPSRPSKAFALDLDDATRIGHQPHP